MLVLRVIAQAVPAELVGAALTDHVRASSILEDRNSAVPTGLTPQHLREVVQKPLPGAVMRPQLILLLPLLLAERAFVRVLTLFWQDPRIPALTLWAVPDIAGLLQVNLETLLVNVVLKVPQCQVLEYLLHREPFVLTGPVRAADLDLPGQHPPIDLLTRPADQTGLALLVVAPRDRDVRGVRVADVAQLVVLVFHIQS